MHSSSESVFQTLAPTLSALVVSGFSCLVLQVPPSKRRKGNNQMKVEERSTAWKGKTETFCRQHGITQSSCQWTAVAEANGADLAHLSDRAKTLLDVAVGWAEKEAGSGDFRVESMLADVSQCLSRKPWSVDGVLPSLTTSSSIFSYERQRLLSVLEFYRIMGFETEKLPDLESMLPSKLQSLIGEAMAMPSIGLVLGALVTELPGLFRAT